MQIVNEEIRTDASWISRDEDLHSFLHPSSDGTQTALPFSIDSARLPGLSLLNAPSPLLLSPLYMVSSHVHCSHFVVSTRRGDPG